MGKHKDRAKKQKARSSGRKHKYGTDSYDTGSSEFSGDDAVDYQAFKDGGFEKSDEDSIARDYINEQSSTCGRVTSALFCITTLLMAGFAITWANKHGPPPEDCGEQNPLNVSYFNWLILLSVSLGAVFLMQLLVSLLSCCTSPNWDGPLPSSDWEGPMRSARELKMGARRLACASFMVMVMGSILAFWCLYGLWVYTPPFDIYHNGTVVAARSENEELFASPNCFKLHECVFVMEIMALSYIGLYLACRCFCGVGICKAISLLKPVLM